MEKSIDDSIDEQLAKVTREQWTHLESLVDAVDPHSPGHWAGGEVVSRTAEGKPVISMPYYSYSEPLLILVEKMYEYGVVVAFGWVAWSERNQKLLSNLVVTETRANDLVKYMVTVLRSDRFSEGYLGKEIRSGDFLAALRAIIHHYGRMTS